MQFRILPEIESGSLDKVLPPAFRSLARDIDKLSPRFTVILFRHDSNDVVRSTLVRQALKRIPAVEGRRVVAVAYDFTEEARHSLHEAGVFVLSLRHYGWTDTSHEEIRVLIGARVKGLRG